VQYQPQELDHRPERYLISLTRSYRIEISVGTTMRLDGNVLLILP